MQTITEVQCDRIESCANGIRALTLRILAPHSVPLASLRPGQHVALRYPLESACTQQRLYTITRRPANDVLEITVRRSGRGGISDRLHDSLETGGRLGLGEVAGEITADALRPYQRIGMIAGGIGITLPLALLREFDMRQRAGLPTPEVALLLCAPKITDIAFLHELLTLELSASWFRLHVFITRETIRESDRFHLGRPSKKQLDWLGEPQAVIICGSHALAVDMGDMASHRFPQAQLLVEAFTPPTPVDFGSTQDQVASCGHLRLLDHERLISLKHGASLLEILEAHGISIQSKCRSGICGSCRIKIHAGRVRQEQDFSLSASEKKTGYALACCTYAIDGDISATIKT